MFGLHASPVLDELLRTFTGLFSIYGWTLGLVTFVIQLLLVLGVYREASDRVLRGRKLWFLGPFAWAFLTFIGGVMSAAVYWALHHSTFSPPDEAE